MVKVNKDKINLVTQIQAEALAQIQIVKTTFGQVDKQTYPPSLQLDSLTVPKGDISPDIVRATSN